MTYYAAPNTYATQMNYSHPYNYSSYYGMTTNSSYPNSSYSPNGVQDQIGLMTGFKVAAEVFQAGRRICKIVKEKDGSVVSTPDRL